MFHSNDESEYINASELLKSLLAFHNYSGKILRRNGLEELLRMEFSLLQGVFQEKYFGDFMLTLLIQPYMHLKSMFISSGKKGGILS